MKNDNIKNIIGNSYKFALIISGNCNTTKESYNNGEIGFINSYNIDGKYYILKSIDEIYDKIKEYLWKNEGLEIEKSWIYNGDLESDKLIDIEGNELTEAEKELWQDERISAYNNHYKFTILINGNNIKSEDLFHLLGEKIKVED